MERLHKRGAHMMIVPLSSESARQRGWAGSHGCLMAGLFGMVVLTVVAAALAAEVTLRESATTAPHIGTAVV